VTFFVLGIDGASWNVIRPNLKHLVNFAKLIKIGKASELVLQEKPISAAIWCGMFSGKEASEHKHLGFTKEGKIVKREDIPLEFIWDVLNEKIDVRVLNVPFVVPPYSFNVDFSPPAFGLPSNEREWREELSRVTGKTKELLAEKPDLLISVFTLLDRVQHFHWGEPAVLEWYKLLDMKIGEIMWTTNFLPSRENKLIVISDHGFCSFGEAKVQTLPKKTPYGELKGDHHEVALCITYNVSKPLRKPQDLFHILRKEFGG
jgi:predicted AlkP superfamily phosphohydrolase/phosphomutase